MFLKGEGWPEAATSPEASGIFLVVVKAGSHRFNIASRNVELRSNAGAVGGTRTCFRGALTSDVRFVTSLDPYSREASNSTISMTVLEDFLPLRKLRGAGVFIQDIEVDVYWSVSGVGLALSQAVHLVSGYMTSSVYDDEAGTVTFTVEDRGLEGELPFPPTIATVDRLPSLDEEDIGKVYPVVFGTVKKSPCLSIGSGLYLACEDRFRELDGANPVSEVYDGDDALGVNAQGYASDADGYGYAYVDPNLAVGSKDVTADLIGYEPGTVREIVRRLFGHYVSDENVLEDGTLTGLEQAFSRLSLGLVANERVSSAIEFARDRLVKQIPAAMIQAGRKYKIQPLLWSRDTTMALSTDTNILRAVKAPTMIPRSSIYNDFVVSFGRSGLRGDYTGVAVRNPDNDSACLRSSERYGRRAMTTFDAGDLVDQDSAEFLADWLVETYSKMRIAVSYACSLEALAADLWNTVRLFDHNQGWSHGPLFKVTSIGFGDGPVIEIGLLSVDDYLEVNVGAYS